MNNVGTLAAWELGGSRFSIISVRVMAECLLYMELLIITDGVERRFCKVKVTPLQIKILDPNLIAPVSEEKCPSVHKTLPKRNMAVILHLIFRGLMITGLSRTWPHLSNVPHTVVVATSIIN